MRLSGSSLNIYWRDELPSPYPHTHKHTHTHHKEWWYFEESKGATPEQNKTQRGTSWVNLWRVVKLAFVHSASSPPPPTKSRPCNPHMLKRLVCVAYGFILPEHLVCYLHWCSATNLFLCQLGCSCAPIPLHWLFYQSCLVAKPSTHIQCPYSSCVFVWWTARHIYLAVHSVKCTRHIEKDQYTESSCSKKETKRTNTKVSG